MSSVEKSETPLSSKLQLISGKGRNPFVENHELDPRHIWATVRAWMEADNYKHLRGGGTRKNHWNLLENLLHIFGYGLKFTGLYNKGVANALDIQLRSIELRYPNLPEAFDGYTIMHLTDLHFDALAGIDDKIVDLIADVEVDLCAFTGDYRMEVHGSFHHIMPAMQKVVSAVSAKDGIVATLGNHDTVFMVNPFEAMGVRVLANESITLERAGDVLHVTGTDDVHYYYNAWRNAHPEQNGPRLH